MVQASGDSVLWCSGELPLHARSWVQTMAPEVPEGFRRSRGDLCGRLDLKAPGAVSEEDWHSEEMKRITRFESVRLNGLNPHGLGAVGDIPFPEFAGYCFHDLIFDLLARVVTLWCALLSARPAWALELDCVAGDKRY